MRFLPTKAALKMALFQLSISGAYFAVLIGWAIENHRILSNPSSPTYANDLKILHSMSYELIIVWTAVLVQRMTVATKYAYQQPLDYKRLMSEQLTMEELRQDEILAGWVNVSPSLLGQELQLAGIRLGLNPNKVYWSMSEEQHDRMDCMLNNNKQQEGGKTPQTPSSSAVVTPSSQTPITPVTSVDVINTVPVKSLSLHLDQGKRDTVLVSAVELAQNIFREANRSGQAISGKLRRVMGYVIFVSVFITLTIRALYGMPPVGDNVTQIIVFLCSMYCQYWFPTSIFIFVRVSMLDYRRRWKCLEFMLLLAGRTAGLVNKTRHYTTNAIINALGTPNTPRDLSQRMKAFAAGGVGSFHIADGVEPILPLLTSDNVVAWLVTRRLLLNVGLRYVVRLNAYNSQALGLTVILAVALLSMLLTNGDGFQAPEISAAAEALVILVLLASHVFTMLYFAVLANAQADEHVAQLMSRHVEARQVCHRLEADAQVEQALKFRQCAEMLEATAGTVRCDAQLQPVRIIGLKADKQLLRALGAGAISSISLALALLRNLLG
jgi:hypothetical protein